MMIIFSISKYNKKDKGDIKMKKEYATPVVELVEGNELEGIFCAGSGEVEPEKPGEPGGIELE